jgi:sucrose phosphorylase
MLFQLRLLYGDAADEIATRLKERVETFRREQPNAAQPVELTERDALLITYGDTIRSPDEAPLRTLERFLHTQLGELITGVHILPFFPWSSDDGFSVIDYRQVDPALGGWREVRRLAQDYLLMFDAVINHASSQSAWFQAYLRDEAPYRDYFITADPAWDLQAVARPRTLPLLTPVETHSGTRQAWTTFSADQIDLNYTNPALLLEIIDLLLFYVAQGARLIRLDAIAYLWKESGTSCIHLPQTHAVIKLMRAVLDAAAPGVLLITETNVPHAANISYFGAPLAEADAPVPGRTDEAQLVYQFPLAPLILHTFGAGSAAALSRWVSELEAPGPFFNFIASHDGIGVMPAVGLLTAEEIGALAERTLAHGGHISYRNNPDGTQSPYELNITLYDALNDPAQHDLARDVPRFLASQAIMLALAGLPGIYLHSLLGARNCTACVETTGRARSINREKFDLGEIEQELADPNQRMRLVFDGYRRLLTVRREQSAFHLEAPQRVLPTPPEVFSLLRSPVEGAPVLCITNITDAPVTLPLLADMGLPAGGWRDLLHGRVYADFTIESALHLDPYQTLWLTPV